MIFLELVWQIAKNAAFVVAVPFLVIFMLVQDIFGSACLSAHKAYLVREDGLPPLDKHGHTYAGDYYCLRCGQNHNIVADMF